MSSIHIAFQVTSQVQQIVVMHDTSIDSDTLVSGLANGTYLTDIDFINGDTKYITDKDGRIIAEIVEQFGANTILSNFE